MGFHRTIDLPEPLDGAALTAHMIGIGIRLQGRGQNAANIEDTLYSASVVGLAGDFRVLSLLVDWIDVHSERINADRLYRILSETQTARVSAFWAAIAAWKNKDPRFSRYGRLYRGKRIDLLSSGTEFYISRKGEDPRFAGSPLRVPKEAGLRHRAADILQPHELAKTHQPYYYRLLIGPTYRADMWAELTANPELTPSELARKCYGSFATAWHVKQEWNILQQAK